MHTPLLSTTFFRLHKLWQARQTQIRLRVHVLTGPLFCTPPGRCLRTSWSLLLQLGGINAIQQRHRSLLVPALPPLPTPTFRPERFPACAVCVASVFAHPAHSTGCEGSGTVRGAVLVGGGTACVRQLPGLRCCPW